MASYVVDGGFDTPQQTRYFGVVEDGQVVDGDPAVCDGIEWLRPLEEAPDIEDLLSHTRATLNTIAEEQGIEDPGSFHTKRDLAETMLGEGVGSDSDS